MSSFKLKIKKLNPEAKLPSYAHTGDAGLDLFAVEKVVVPAGERATISTGLAFEIPEGYVGLVWDKSGLAFKRGLTSVSGVLDSGYRGELFLCILNTSREDYIFAKGDKVAQLLIQPILHTDIEQVEELSDSSRGEGRFGSTGKQ
ncbi:MAG: deoxyuridine 5'-triphosphate nucleotidohydrolase [Candidatus Vogelbacteria bacterium RIFOXYD1_FULL_44_32]|uniref:dUTP diphosphatase n=1 Tax=Candidatus Vogelbacteria bacterium RIFOXYD1_FULL_44_32 TaxID=1802438 RepID=A0A1G2QG21_9BACT|nr:MAG: deoxyuridine 5'-triphosphate nucleotidohydrolase [Candidatus Vogelbacteria bacterium RIFOXYD1_FULL_44_32]